MLIAALGAAQEDLHVHSFVMDAHVQVMSRSLPQGIDIGQGGPYRRVDLLRLAVGGVTKRIEFAEPGCDVSKWVG